MNTYLKIDAELPVGLSYLDLNSISLPQAIVNVGNLVSGFRFSGGLDDLVGTSATIVGTPTKTADGYMLGNNGYIDTGLKESAEFTWIALVKVSSDGDYTPVISSFIEKNQSATGYSQGCNVGKKTTAVKKSATVDSTSDFNATPVSVGSWAIYALSRKNIGTTGYANYHYAYKVANVALQKSSSTQFLTVPASQQNITIGHAPKANILIPAGSTMMNFASVHSKGLDLTGLESLMNSLVAELGGQGIVL